MDRIKRLWLSTEWMPITWVSKLGRMPGGYRVSGTYRRSEGVKMVDHLTPYDERAVILHEVMHALWDRAGLSEQLSSKTEEMVLAGLDSWLLNLLRDNPDFVEYLTEDI